MEDSFYTEEQEAALALAEEARLRAKSGLTSDTPEIVLPNDEADTVIKNHLEAQQGSEIYNNNMPFNDEEEKNSLIGTFTGVGVELGAGIGASIYFKRGQTALRALRIARVAAVGGAVAPEPVTTALGLAGIAASEAAIWGVSNLLGQSTRVAFGIQEDISAGEMIAASIFGVGVTARYADKAVNGIDKALRLGDGVGAMKAWKSMSGTVNNAKTFLSGASLGVAETFVRQELEQLMNDDANRNAYEYLFAGAMGGTFNTVLGAWARKGEWGMGQAVKLTENSLGAINKHIGELEAQITGPKSRRSGKLQEQLNEAYQAREYLQDFDRQIKGAAETDAKIKEKSEADAEPLEITPEKLKEEAKERDTKRKEQEPLEEEVPKTEEPETKLEGEEAPKTEEPETKLEGEEAPKTEESFDPAENTRKLLDEEADTLDLDVDQSAELEVIKKFEAGGVNDDNVSTLIPTLERNLAPIVERTTVAINEDITSIADLFTRAADGEAPEFDIKALKRLRSNMHLLSRAQQMTDLAETTAGRAMQAADPRSFDGKYNEYTTKYSFRAIAQRVAYNKFSNSVDNMLNGGGAKDVVDLFDSYLDVPKKSAKSGKLKFGRDVTDDALEDMEWKDVKDMVRTYNENVPKGGEKIKMSGKGVTRQSIKDKLKSGQQDVKTANQVTGTINKTIKTLNQRLNRLRSVAFDEGTPLYDKEGKPLTDEYGAPKTEEVDSAVAVAVREAFDNDPEIKELKTKVKYYKELVDEVDKIEAAQKELDAVLSIEGAGILTDIQKKIMKENKIPIPPEGRFVSDAVGEETKQSLLKELQQKITQSKKRSRDKVRDVRKAQEAIDKRDFFISYENTLSKNIDIASAGVFTKGMQTANSWRKMNLINQLPSILAGVPTALYSLGREGFAHPAASFIKEMSSGSGKLNIATELATDRFTGFWSAFLTGNGLTETARRAYKEGFEPTGGSENRMAQDFKGRMTIEGSVGKAKRKAVAAAESKEALEGLTTKSFSLANLTHIFSIGVRGIGALDAVAKRQLVQGTLMGKAKENARLSLRSKNPNVTEEEISTEASKIYESLWRDDNGLAVLSELGEYDYAVDEINNAILLARKNIPDDIIHKDMGEKLIAGIRKFAGEDPHLELIVDMFMPYISVPIRGAYKGLTLSAGPLNLARSKWSNPYDKKISDLRTTVKSEENLLADLKSQGGAENKTATQLNKEVIERSESKITEAQTKIISLERYSDQYAQEKLVDTLVGGSLFIAGIFGGMAGGVTGSLNWMTADQREKNKLKPFQGPGGLDYRAAAPLAIPLAIGADLAHYFRLRNQGALVEKQNMFMLMGGTMIQLTQEVPLFQGFKSLTTLATAGTETRVREMIKLAGSYMPVPAQLRKLVQGSAIAMGDGTVADLKGGAWSDRILYAALGVKPVNRKTDRFGEDIQGDATFLTTTVSRQLPKFNDANELNTTFEYILATDKFNQIGDKPTRLNGAPMDKWVDDEGMTLSYAFSKELENTKLRVDGRRALTIKEAVTKLISSKSWQKKYNAEFLSQTETRKFFNEGMQELDALLNKYYSEMTKKIADNKSFTNRFIGQDGNSLTEYLGVDQRQRNLPSILR